MKYNTRHGDVASLIIFLLVALFLCSALLMTVLGLLGYRGAREDISSASDMRIAFSYVAGKVHAADKAQDIRIEDRSGVRMLILPEQLDEGYMETRIYYADGALCEIFTFSDIEIEPQYGTRLVELDDFSMEIEDDDLLHMSLVLPNGAEEEMSVFIGRETDL